jgi:hypothetical protein
VLSVISMLKDISPKEQLDEAKRSRGKLATVALAASFVCCEAFYIVRHGDFPSIWIYFATMLFVSVALVFSIVLTELVWLPLVLWLGHMRYTQGLDAYIAPDRHAKLVGQLLDSWWRNETVLNVFAIVFELSICVSIFYLIGPFIGLL